MSEYKEKIISTDDINWLRQELFDSHERNNALHRRLQKVEGADQRFDALKSNMESHLHHANEVWADRATRLKTKVKELQKKIQNLPSVIRWMYNL